MCGQCRSSATGVDWFGAGVADSLAARRRARAELAAAATEMLAGTGVRVTAPPGSMTLSVQNGTGRTRTVTRLDEILGAAEVMTGRRIDPLALAAARSRPAPDPEAS
ncbi:MULTISPECIES: hypothetical protein [unclassified Streptomyces]|uniref:hypothetical protein n=1 Tax=unclassified Streptomyces TaxID=2593676 RepID=UPI00137226E4|nr:MULTISPECIES: hypothetical protein [unclassified Streptomyces]MCW5252045.1 hypothetical protein [Streptomyces sp. SHP 1-2]MYU24797.1 hypothetical protein [Streptomyces sp. SID8352]